MVCRERLDLCQSNPQCGWLRSNTYSWYAFYVCRHSVGASYHSFGQLDHNFRAILGSNSHFMSFSGCTIFRLVMRISLSQYHPRRPGPVLRQGFCCGASRTSCHSSTSGALTRRRAHKREVHSDRLFQQLLSVCLLDSFLGFV
jgi:hypothetical protein